MEEIGERQGNGTGAQQEGDHAEQDEQLVDDGCHDTTADEEVQEKKVDGDGENESPKHSDKKGKSFPKPASSRASTNLDKKTQQMVAELKRLKSQMVEFKQSVHRPPVRPFTPDIFNSLSPYYNQYLVNCTIQDLQQDLRIPRGFGHRPTALGVVDPEVAWRMDNFPNPVQNSRLPGRLFRPADWSKNTSTSRDNQGSTRLPPLPMPTFPKFNQSNYQPNRMTYDELRNFREDLSLTYERQAQKQARVDYERTVQDWHRMNLSELKKLPPSPRYHIQKAIVSYLGTSRGSSQALIPLTKELDEATPKPIAQP